MRSIRTRRPYIRRRSLAWGAAAFVLMLLAAPGGAETPQTAPVIAVSTAMIELAVQDVFGDKAAIHPIIPPGSCPGHYDLKPRDLAALAGARAIILHEFQAGMRDKLVKAGIGGGNILVVPDRGSLATPPGYEYLLERVAALVSETVPELAGPVGEGLLEARLRVEKARALAEEEAGGRLRGRPVVAARFQKDFVIYFGLEAAAVLEPGELSARELDRLVRAARSAGAQAVVENKTSGGKSGEALAEMLGVPLITLSNFPEKQDGRLDYSDFLLDNVRALGEGLGP